MHTFPLLRAAALCAGLSLLLPLSACAHSGKARFHLIIDTDGAPDDLRTLCLLLGNREAEVLAIVSSDGALPPDEGARQTLALLHEFHHEGIPVGCGRRVRRQAPPWRATARAVRWGATTDTGAPIPPAVEVLAQSIAAEPEAVTVVALGALTNWADLLDAYPECAGRIERILWYDGRLEAPAGENTRSDPAAAHRLLGGAVPVEIIAANPAAPIAAGGALLDTVAAVGNRYARQILRTHRTAPLDSLCRCGHLQAWDDLVAVRLYAPELFRCRSLAGNRSCSTLRDTLAATQAVAAIGAILRGKPDSESRVFYGFPLQPDLYAADVAPMIDTALQRHGASEWRAAVLTNELHGHLGIYATIGVKMGIRAREYFNIGIDDLQVTSHAGSRPPVSCLNDGLQVGTGATVGHGLIRVPPTDDPRPSAEFRFKDRAIRLTLKPDCARRIRNEVAAGVARYGADTPAYWQYVRALALRYWADLDRHQIFDIQVL